tara:strand:- start:74 stop:484 length:411 start_codon:yes stop_codon:yes gene_type:complete
MATVTGTSGVVKIKLDSDSGGTVAQVGEVRSFTFDETSDTIESTVMGNTSRNYKGGLKDATLSLECFWDQADSQQLLLDSGALIDFEISPSGTGSGSKKYSGEGVVTSKSLNNTTDGLVEATFAVQVSNGVTEGAH